MKRVIVAALVLLFTICAHATAVAQSEPTTVRVGFPIQKGLTEIDKNGNYTGYSYEYLEHVAQFTNWKYEYVTVDGDLNAQILTLMDMLSRGEIDLLGCTIKNEQLQELYEYPEYSYGVAYTVLCSLNTNTSLNEATFSRLATQGIRVAAYEIDKLRIKLLDDFCKSNGYTYTIKTYPTDVSLTDVLDAGEADVSLGVDLNRDGHTKIVASLGGVPYYFIGTKGNTALMNEYDIAVKKVEETEPYLQSDLYDDFFSNSSNGFVLTDSEKQYLEKLEPIKAIFVNQMSPFQVMNDDGSASGISVSLLKAISDATGLKFEFITKAQWESIKYDFSGNAIYLGAQQCYETMHNPDIIISHPYAQADMALFAKSNLELCNLSDKILAITNEDYPLNGYDYSEIKYYATLQDCISAVANGEADYGLSNSYSVSYYLSRNYLNMYSVVLPGIQSSYSFAFARPADIKLLSIFNRFIDSQPENETYGYLMSELSVPPDEITLYEYIRLYPAQALAIASIVLLIIFAASFYSMRMHQKQKLLEAESRAKTEFMSRMSHDMRTPMNAIMGLSRLALDVVKEPDGVDYIDKINKSGRYLLGLINDTLDMSRIESGKIVLYPEPYSLSEFFQSLNDLLSPKATEKNVRLTINAKCQDAPPLMLDKIRFTQIFVNLATNAIKFTPQGGSVEISLELLERRENLQNIRISVSDTGIGMSREFQERMYDRFEQERETGTTMETGTGLGLSIVKKLTDIMGGKIYCVSAPNKGTTFTVVMSPEIADTSSATREEDNDQVNLSVLNGSHVLLVEDHPLNVKVAVKILEKQGVIVDCAENGQVAIDKFSAASEGQYDAILMDIRMPVLDGLSAAKAIRALNHADAKHIPIIAMTANAYKEDIQLSKDAGMDAHLSKPIEPEILFNTLCRLYSKNKK